MSKYNNKKTEVYTIYRVFQSDWETFDEYAGIRSRAFNKSGTIRKTLGVLDVDVVKDFTSEYASPIVAMVVLPDAAILIDVEDGTSTELDSYTDTSNINYIAQKVLSKPYSKIY